MSGTFPVQFSVIRGEGSPGIRLHPAVKTNRMRQNEGAKGDGIRVRFPLALPIPHQVAGGSVQNGTLPLTSRFAGVGSIDEQGTRKDSLGERWTGYGWAVVRSEATRTQPYSDCRQVAKARQQTIPLPFSLPPERNASHAFGLQGVRL